MLKNRFFLSKDEKLNHANLVTVKVYGPNKLRPSSQSSFEYFKDFGHVTLKTRPERGKGIYVSFYPGKKEKCCHEACRSYQLEPEEKICPTFDGPTNDSEHGHFHTYELDSKINAGRSSAVKRECGDRTFPFIDLDVDAIEKAFRKLLTKKPLWTIKRHPQLATPLGTPEDNPPFVCSSIVYYLLMKGGLNKYIKKDANKQIESAKSTRVESFWLNSISGQSIRYVQSVNSLYWNIANLMPSYIVDSFGFNRSQFLDSTLKSTLSLPFDFFGKIAFPQIYKIVGDLAPPWVGFLLSVISVQETSKLAGSIFYDTANIRLLSPKHLEQQLTTAEEKLQNHHDPEHVSSPTT